MELRFHLEHGYMNDPNGLSYFAGQYHAFFQTPFGSMDPAARPVGWGHAVSDDLIHWHQVANALIPEHPYEIDKGCYSGSALEKDGKLYLFYTGASRPSHSVNVAWSEDGIHFEKYAGNPVIPRGPADSPSWNFRDPKVLKIGDIYHLVIGTSANDIGRVVRYTSTDLLHWEYAGVLYENGELGHMLECADFFPLGDRYVLMVSLYTRKVVMIVGRFDGETFTPERICQPEKGCSFYAAQTFLAPDGRRMLMAWAFEPAVRGNLSYIGGTTTMRELKLVNGMVHSTPVKELFPYLQQSDPCVRIAENRVSIHRPDGSPFGCTWEYLHTREPYFEGERPLRFDGPVTDVQILHSDGLMEVFINDGSCNFTFYPDWEV